MVRMTWLRKSSIATPARDIADTRDQLLPMYAIFIRKIRNGGVLGTLSARMESLRDIAPGTIGVCFYVEAEEALPVYPGIDYVRVRELLPFLSHLMIPWKISRWIAAREFSITHLILRTHFPTPMFGPAFSDRSYTLVTEHHTILEAELRSGRRTSGWMLAQMAKLFRPFADAVTDAKVALTSEILSSESFSKPSIVIGNASSHSGIGGVSYPEFNGRDLHILTVLSKDFPWNGLERMLESVDLWTASEPNLRVTFSVLGSVNVRNTPANNRVSINYLGFMSIDQIRKVAASAHLGFSTLGLWKKSLEEACSLKSRLYIDLGLPYISGYRDPDVGSSELFVLEVENSECPVPWASVEPFLNQLKIQRTKVDGSLKIARERISPAHKSFQLAKFLESIRA